MGLEGLKLRLPEDKDRVNKLRGKLREYAERVERMKKELERKNPEMRPELVMVYCRQSSDYIKLSVLSELLHEKIIDAPDFYLELAIEIKQNAGEIFNVGSYTNNYNTACAVTNDYCETGRANTQGGTGLK